MLIGGLVVCLVMTLGFAPHSTLGRLLRPGLVEAPAAWLNAAKPRQLLVGALAVAVLAGFAIAAPELLPFVGMVDLTAMADLTLLVLLAGGAKPIRRVAEAALGVLRRRIAPAIACARMGFRLKVSRPLTTSGESAAISRRDSLCSPVFAHICRPPRWPS